MTEKKYSEDLGKDLNVAYYQTFLSAWVENRMEVDKQILLLSSLAIGLLMTFLSDFNKGIYAIILWIIPVFSFVSSILVTLYIFHLNSDYCRDIIDSFSDRKPAEKTLSSQDKRLKKVSLLAYCLFFLGVFSSLVLVAYLALYDKLTP